METLKKHEGLQSRLLRQVSLPIRLKVVGNATPASKVLSSNLPGVAILVSEGVRYPDLMDISKLAPIAPDDVVYAAPNDAFGKFSVILDKDAIGNVKEILEVRVVDITGTHTVVASLSNGYIVLDIDSSVNFASANAELNLIVLYMEPLDQGNLLQAGVLFPQFVPGLGPSPVNLLTAANYASLAKSGISDAGTSAITGSIAVSPIAATAITGFALTLDGGGQFSTSAKVSGRVYAADYAAPTPATLTQAVSDMEAAYTDAAGRTGPDFTNLGAGTIGGMTLTPGLYKWTSNVNIASNLTLTGGANDTYIMQISGTLALSAATSILLTGGVQAKNIVWQVTGAITLGTTSSFKGVILAQTSIAMQTGSSITGRTLAQTAVTLDSTTVIESV